MLLFTINELGSLVKLKVEQMRRESVKLRVSTLFTLEREELEYGSCKLFKSK